MRVLHIFSVYFSQLECLVLRETLPFKNISSVMIRTIFSDFLFFLGRVRRRGVHMLLINLKSLGEIHGVRVSQQDNVASLDCKRFTDFGFEAYGSTLKSG